LATDYDDILGSHLYAFDQDVLDKLESVIIEELINSGVESVLLTDMAGNIIAKGDNGHCDIDMYSLAALASANFSAVDAMAKILGENEFSLLFHKGDSESIHFTRVFQDFLLISIFNKRISLGLLRLKIEAAVERFKRVWKVDHASLSSPF